MKNKSKKYILAFREISRKDIPLVGGKNASLGEMIRELSSKGINIPEGFATTSYAYRDFLKKNNLFPKLKETFKKLDLKNIKTLQEVGKEARNLILKAKFPEDLKREIIKAYRELGKRYGKNPDVAVRSSATAEDLPSASFAGQHETYLNVQGEKALIEAVKKSIASLFTNRAISYREKRGFDHFKIALSVGVQKMVRSDLASAGVMFTLDTETGFKDIILINSSWGLGETVVKGKVVPDEFLIFKPTLKQGFEPIISKNLGTKKRKLVYGAGAKATKEVSVSQKAQNQFTLTDSEILTLAKWACLIEKHYGIPQDIEWAKDGKTKKIFIVQSRPETVHVSKKKAVFKEYILKEKKPQLLLEGIAIGEKIAAGKVRVIKDIKRINEFQAGEILVTINTDPDWEPIMKISSAIITDLGGRTSHAAIVSRELGVPCMVGTKKATSIFKNGQEITIDCSSGETGKIYQGKVKWEEKEHKLKQIPKTKTKIMLNIGTPEIAFHNSFLPHRGVGLAREEFIIASKIKIHPLALINYPKLDKKLKKQIAEITPGYKNKKQFFVDELARGIGQIGAAFSPEPVIVRFSDFKTNEYASLLGGHLFEPEEENPMIGWRGASRYYDPQFKEAFLLECQALKIAREKFGLKNIWVMVPFCRTLEEGEKVLKIMKEGGLERRKKGLRVIVMCEIPSNAILVEEFLKIFDGMSIGSNDLTQLILGIDRDSATLKKVGNEKNKAVKEMIKKVIKICRQKKKYIGICGQAPSDFPEFAEFLVEQGIESISLNPDTVIKTTLDIAKKEKLLKGRIK